jgi:hypothetical protein
MHDVMHDSTATENQYPTISWHNQLAMSMNPTTRAAVVSTAASYIGDPVMSRRQNV